MEDVEEIEETEEESTETPSGGTADSDMIPLAAFRLKMNSISMVKTMISTWWYQAG